MLPMGDVSKSIFLSTKGTDESAVPKELKSVLDFIRKDTPKNDTETDDAYVKTLQRTIRRVKENRELERSFMTLDEIRQLGKEEGLAEGMLRARKKDIFDFLKGKGEVSESLKARIMSEKNVESLKSMLKMVVSVASVDEFEEKITNL